MVYRVGSDTRMVLKVAINATHEGRLRAEADVLASPRQTNIVRYIETVTVSGRVGILMDWAGAESLAAIIRGPDRPSLDMVSRYGEELLQAIDYLEQQGMAHRDIKPNNIAIGAAGGTGRKRLALFDFSLSRTPPENIAAGTRPYLDPFLRLRRPARWEQYAERYAAAPIRWGRVAVRTPALRRHHFERSHNNWRAGFSWQHFGADENGARRVGKAASSATAGSSMLPPHLACNEVDQAGHSKRFQKERPPLVLLFGISRNQNNPEFWTAANSLIG